MGTHQSIFNPLEIVKEKNEKNSDASGDHSDITDSQEISVKTKHQV